jgi:hypothetical protein
MDDDLSPSMSSGPTFEIPVRPERRYPFEGGVEYEGSTTFVLEPGREGPADVHETVVAVLAAGPYRYGDFLSLPMPLYLVKDEETGDVFRVAVRDGTVRFHVLPETESRGLRAMYDRLCEHGGGEFHVERRIQNGSSTRP